MLSIIQERAGSHKALSSPFYAVAAVVVMLQPYAIPFDDS